MISVTLKKRIRGSVSGWLFVLPMTVGICVFTLVPIVQSFYYSFFNYDVGFRLRLCRIRKLYQGVYRIGNEQGRDEHAVFRRREYTRRHVRLLSFSAVSGT